MQINGLDEIDNEIINLLQENARISYSDIGEKVGLSRTAVKNRILFLEKKGIITGYRAVINPQESSEVMNFIINIETKAENFNSVKHILAGANETVTLLQTTGTCRLVAICSAKDVETMKKFVNRIYSEVQGITYINANSVLEVIKGSIISQ